jgi:hypothetical protein
MGAPHKQRQNATPEAAGPIDLDQANPRSNQKGMAVAFDRSDQAFGNASAVGATVADLPDGLAARFRV